MGSLSHLVNQDSYLLFKAYLHQCILLVDVCTPHWHTVEGITAQPNRSVEPGRHFDEINSCFVKHCPLIAS